MSFEKTLLMGLIAGCTIFLGLPFARVSRIGTRGRVLASTLSAGILAFLFYDVVGASNQTVEGALDAARQGTGTWARFTGLLMMLVVGFAVGLVSLGAIERRWLRRPPPMAGGSVEAAVVEPGVSSVARAAIDPLRMGMLIAIAIGIHNFSEGLAIGVAAHASELSLATILVVGFALHNTTEGFGVVGPLDGSARPSWGWLALVGLVGGGPTVIGTALGWQVRSPALELAFLALAAGAILYVVLEIWGATRRHGFRTLAASGLALGFLIAYGTDLVVHAAGA